MARNCYLTHKSSSAGEIAEQRLTIGHPELESLLAAQKVDVLKAPVE
jgi:hypothetical protein